MRLICTMKDDAHENAEEFSYYLSNQGIENSCEAIETEEGFLFRIWVHEEDCYEKAKAIYKEYQIHPKDPKYRASFQADAPAQTLFSETEEEQEETPKRRRILSSAPYGPISVMILLCVIVLFMLAQMQRVTTLPPKIPGVIHAPLLAPFETTLLYDYPSYFLLQRELFKLYTKDDNEKKNPPSQESKELMQQMRASPPWMGFYTLILERMKNPHTPKTPLPPRFVKLKEGQVWRLFTPSLLHLDLLHIFFNVLWFIMLGNQIEYRIGAFRYLLFIFSTAIASNTAQYLMSGPFFMGLSGIVVAMAAFIWARQQLAPWEGYLLNRFTLIFLSIFVVGMFLLQLFLFIYQLALSSSLSIGIANTAHLTGALIGYLLGRLRFFAIRPKLYKS